MSQDLIVCLLEFLGSLDEVIAQNSKGVLGSSAASASPSRYLSQCSDSLVFRNLFHAVKQHSRDIVVEILADGIAVGSSLVRHCETWVRMDRAGAGAARFLIVVAIDGTTGRSRTRHRAGNSRGEGLGSRSGRLGGITGSARMSGIASSWHPLPARCHQWAHRASARHQ